MNLVYKHDNTAILYSAKNLLVSNGIDCKVHNEHSASIGGNLGMVNTAAELWVLNSADTEKAINIIKVKFESTTSKPDWECSVCSEENDGSFEVCWKCQAESAAS